MAEPTTIGITQLCATADVEQNLDTAARLTEGAAKAGAKVVFLPEAFAYIGPDRVRNEWLENLDEGGPILSACKRMATENDVDLIAGGFPEAVEDDPRMAYNTCLHIDARGEIEAVYRKIHLFDVDIKDGPRMLESRSTRGGGSAVVTSLSFGLLGLSICYDVRFPTLYQDLVDRGAIALTVPAAFFKATGELHWHVLLQSRAIECQAYVIAPAQYGLHGHRDRQSYGHAVVIDPWGRIIVECAEDQDDFAVAEIDPAKVERVRTELPSLSNRGSWA